MRIAISTDDNNGLDSIVSPHFGRCPYYVMLDMDGQQVKDLQALPNPYYGRHEPGQVPHFIQGQGAEVMISGGMGRRAIAAFQHYGIQAVTGASGTVRHALAQYLAGVLQGAEPCRESTMHAHAESSTVTSYEQDEAGRLREEVEMLRRQLDEAQARLDQLPTG
jgi:predicted Fe-Mo cluster-binding NifX family protein